MTPQAFIEKWQAAQLRERASVQEHFIDLCRLIGEPTPAEADPDGTWFTFERGANKTTGGKGWADVWRRGCFGWEYKSKGKDLTKAFAQLQQYAIALENPPLLVVSDIDQIIIHTNFTNTVAEIHTLTLADIATEKGLKYLRWLFQSPEQFKPGKTCEDVTKEVAAQFVELAYQLRERGYESQRVAHFINKLIFCLFAEDIGILPPDLFTRLLTQGERRPASFESMCGQLFTAMQKGGLFGFEIIEWFNGGLFNDADVIPLKRQELKLAVDATKQDWSHIEPAIFGTLFERGLDPDKRSQLGAHYTDSQAIMRLIEPVILTPLRTHWDTLKNELAHLMDKANHSKRKTEANNAVNNAKTLFTEFLQMLRSLRILDPACGSGNFLYLALLGLKDLEHQALIEAEALGLPKQFPDVGPQQFLGIELSTYAAELARVTVWIGHIQWMIQHGYNIKRDPILEPLFTIECRDALLTPTGEWANWPDADFIVGNPPFLGNKRLLSELGEDYVTALRAAYHGKVSDGADLVMYWFVRAGEQLKAGKTQAVGFVSTNSIRGGANRKALQFAIEGNKIFSAWSDEEWVNEGAAVRVSLVCFGAIKSPFSAVLNGQIVSEIYADLTAPSNEHNLDLTKAKRLKENIGFDFMGVARVGDFDIAGDLAREWLKLPKNPNGKPNSDVLKPLTNAKSITDRALDKWVIDFVDMTEREAALYEAPFEYIFERVKPFREKNKRKVYKELWWIHAESRPAMRKAYKSISRYIATPRTAKYRLFVWLSTSILPDTAVISIAKDDDVTFGILHSRFHEIWSLRMGTSLEDRPRYTHTTTFETFPFPEGLTPNIPANEYANNPHAQAIAEAARYLDQLRQQWLNPEELITRQPEVVAGYPDRILPKDEAAAHVLKQRTLTHLYNQRPKWLIHAHQELDRAVAKAYGWDNHQLSDEEALMRLFRLNREREEA
ncbi:class I SAM-dependent DNA methyltransferase [Thioflexithrix psekupsensis]|uniref:site-specific DNA-methyltransferase (adenine-specific) n=1 Tax=Thioflexithrix psekupsensis TaxID=1570016 RepID=A0A251X7M3_9GAMM|nr:DNA methyltransferase [Thioflexithrix psekupsensis]OUD13340.1 SAM-dependent methyltransferase [Thioflexithrix psekupsensis]